MKSVAPTHDMIEGPEAFQRFRDAVKQVLTVPKSAVPNPFGKREPLKEKAERIAQTAVAKLNAERARKKQKPTS